MFAILLWIIAMTERDSRAPLAASAHRIAARLCQRYPTIEVFPRQQTAVYFCEAPAIGR
jgi:N6-adenosine-specific RNA methylase IME4